jgi:hypothetical protein
MMKRLTGFRRTGVLSLTAILGVGALLPGPAMAQNEAVLILDNSGSMWARMDGTPKVSVVRDAVGSLLKEAAGKLDLGILTYGTQKSKDCTATETLKPLGAIDPAADAKAVDGANPKGSAPVAASLTAASQLFKTQTGVRSIILLSDSTDDCKADPCAVAEQLKSQSPLTVVHVIGFDEKSGEELQDLACVSEQTGGVFKTAQNADELNEALRKAFQLAEMGMTENDEGRPLPILAPPQAGFSPGGESGPASNEPGTLVLSAMLAKDGQTLSSGLTWRIFDGQVLQRATSKGRIGFRRFRSVGVAHDLENGSGAVDLLAKHRAYVVRAETEDILPSRFKADGLKRVGRNLPRRAKLTADGGNEDNRFDHY